MKKKTFIFNNSKLYEENIYYFSKNLKKFLKRNNLNFKKLIVLDYGCGNCLLHKYIKFKKIYLFDPNFYMYKIDSIKNYLLLKNKKEVLNIKKKFDLVILNSVIQYINPIEIKKLILKLENKIKKNGLILISDIPKKARVLEIFDTNNFFLILKLMVYFKFNQNYLKNSFNYYKKNFFIEQNKYSKKKYVFLKNFNLIKSRYSLLIHDAKYKIN